MMAPPPTPRPLHDAEEDQRGRFQASPARHAAAVKTRMAKVSVLRMPKRRCSHPDMGMTVMFAIA